jgi:DUF4097 and DUF4098 domain-containing protein YvlB
MKERFDTPGHVVLDVRLSEGRIELETTDAPETVVELTGLDDEDLAELATIELRERSGVYEVVVDVDDRGFRLFSRRSFRLDIQAPHGADVRLSTASAETRGRGRFGEVELESASGDVSFEHVEKDLSIKSASGDVAVEGVDGEADVSTASGDVEIERVARDARVRSASGDVVIGEAEHGVNVQTASGDHAIGAVREGKVTLRSASGDMQVGIKAGSRLYVDAKSMSGETSSELEVGDTRPEGEGPLVELSATAMSGDIRVVRA